MAEICENTNGNDVDDVLLSQRFKLYDHGNVGDKMFIFYWNIKPSEENQNVRFHFGSDVNLMFLHEIISGALFCDFET